MIFIVFIALAGLYTAFLKGRLYFVVEGSETIDGIL